MNAFDFCRETALDLEILSGQKWSTFFVARRMQFQREYLKGVVCSTMLGAEFFTFTARALAGLEGERLAKEFKSEYNLAYRKFIEQERAKMTEEEKYFAKELLTPFEPKYGIHGSSFRCL